MTMNVHKKKYGCIGKRLTHSFSKEIHEQLADYDYELIELAEEEIAPFFTKKEFAAVNVTIPYKQTVLPYLDDISPVAQRIGAVNTVVNKDGRLYGYNTDYYGMKALLERVGIGLQGLGVPYAVEIGLWALAVGSTITVVQRLVMVGRGPGAGDPIAPPAGAEDHPAGETA